MVPALDRGTPRCNRRKHCSAVAGDNDARAMNSTVRICAARPKRKRAYCRLLVKWDEVFGVRKAVQQLQPSHVLTQLRPPLQPQNLQSPPVCEATRSGCGGVLPI